MGADQSHPEELHVPQQESRQEVAVSNPEAAYKHAQEMYAAMPEADILHEMNIANLPEQHAALYNRLVAKNELRAFTADLNLPTTYSQDPDVQKAQESVLFTYLRDRLAKGYLWYQAEAQFVPTTRSAERMEFVRPPSVSHQAQPESSSQPSPRVEVRIAQAASARINQPIDRLATAETVVAQRDQLARSVKLASATSMRARLAADIRARMALDLPLEHLEDDLAKIAATINSVDPKTRKKPTIMLAPEYVNVFLESMSRKIHDPDVYIVTPTELRKEAGFVREMSVNMQTHETMRALTAAHMRLKEADTSPDKIARMQPIARALMQFIGTNMYDICGDAVDTVVTSGLRESSHALSKVNETSAHIGGIAFDMQLLRTDVEGSRWLGATKLATTVKYLLALQEKSNGLITILFEYPGQRPRGKRRSRSPFANLPGFDRDVTFYNKHASGPHIHIQINKAVFERLPQPPPPAEVIRMASIGALSDAQAFEKIALGQQPSVTQLATLDQSGAEEPLTPSAPLPSAQLSGASDTPDNGA